MSSEIRFYIYEQAIGPYLYIGKGQRSRYRSISSRTRGRLYKHAVEKYGLSRCEILAEFALESEALAAEIEAIAAAVSAGKKILNLTRGGDGISGFRHTASTRKDISTKQLNRSSERKREIQEKRAATLATRTQEERNEANRKRSEKLKGRPKPPFTNEHRQRLSLAHIGNSPSNKGVPKTPEEIARRTATRRANKNGSY